MKNKHITGTIFLLFAILSVIPAHGWGGKGHSAIAYIAQRHLTCRAEREVTRLLGGHNMAYWSSWADGLRDDERYDGFTTWHYANADAGYTYATSPKHPDGDVLTAVELCMEQLEQPALNDSLKGMYLKLLIHFVGDMHCPMHAGYASDRGGNGFEVIWNGNKSNLHRVWDSQLIDSAHPWSALEWAMNVDRKMSRRERRAFAPGGPLEWMEETVVLAHSLYLDTPQDKPLSWPYINKYAPVVEERFMAAGYRLARLLNEIF
jgi:hypothetical protein